MEIEHLLLGCCLFSGGKSVNPLLDRLFLDDDIIFLVNIEKKIKKKLSKVFNTFGNIMENRAFNFP